MKRIPWFETVLALTVLSVHLYAAFAEAHNFPNNWFTRDDAFFYFKTAQNISEGLGSTFDGVNPTNGYHPLWMLVCIPIFALARFDLILPLRLMVVVMGGLSAISGILVFRLLKRVVFEPVAMLAATYWVFSLSIHASVTRFGLETGLLVLTILILLRQLQIFEAGWANNSLNSRQVLGLAAMSTLVFLSRLDMVFFAGLVGVWVLLRGTPLRYYLIIDALVVTASVLVSFVLRLGLPLYYGYAPPAIVMAGGLLAIRLPVIHVLGLNKSPGYLKPLQVLARTALATIAGTALTGVVMLALGERLNGFPRAVLLLEAGWTFLLLAAVRLGAAWFRQGQEPSQTKIDWKRLLGEGAIFYGVLGGVLAVYMLVNLTVFGTATPVSGQVKRWWGSPVNHVRGGPAGTLEAFLGLDRNGEFNAWPQISGLAEDISRWVTLQSPIRLLLPQVYLPVLLTMTLAVFIILLANRQQALRAVQRLGLIPLLVGCGFQLLSYNASGYSAVKEWYWAGQMLFTLFLAALLVDLILPRQLKGVRTERLLLAGAAAVSLVWFNGLSQFVVKTMPPGTTRAGEPYVDALVVLEAHTEPGAMIGVTGGGNLGYFIQDRAIVNMDGLINSADYFEALRSGNAADYLYQNGVDYVFANPTILTQLAPFKYHFKGRLVKTGVAFGNKELMKIRPPGK